MIETNFPLGSGFSITINWGASISNWATDRKHVESHIFSRTSVDISVNMDTCTYLILCRD